MSVVHYNGITLPYPLTTAFRQEAVYDEVSQTDMCLIKFDVQVTCLLSTDYLSSIAPHYRNTTVTNAADVMTLIRKDLLTPRKDFSITCDDRNLIPAIPEGNRGDLDARNGPIPQRCDVMQLTSSCFMVHYHIIAHYWANYESDGTASQDINKNLPGSLILYNRWTETVEIDNCDMSRRVREGKYMIRSNNPNKLLADNLRSSLAVLSIPEGFVRESRSYTQAPDGLGLQYRIVDREVYKYPPAPAYEAIGNYIETTTHRGAKRFGEVRLHLKGAKTTPPHRLLQAAMAVAAQKLIISGAKGNTNATGNFRFSLLEYASINVGMYENTVDIQIKCQLQANRETFMGLPFTGAMVVTPGSDTQLKGFTSPGENAATYEIPYTARGSASLLLQAAAYFDPSIRGQNFLVSYPNSSSDNPKTNYGYGKMNMNGVLPGQGGGTSEG